MDVGVLLIRVVFATFVFAFVFGCFKLLNSWNKRVWNFDARFTVVVASKNPTVYSYNPQSQKLLIIPVPQNTQLETAGGYGKWFAGSLWNLGNQEGKKGELLKDSIQKSLGIPVDAWINEGGEALFEEGGSNFVSAVVKAISGYKSNLTFFDRLGLLMSNTSISNRRKIDLETNGVIKNVTLQDGEKGFEVVPDKAKVVFEVLRDDSIFSEGKRVVIVNSTKRLGLASEVARLVSTLGTRVVAIESNQTSVRGCTVQTEQKNIESYSAKSVAKVLGCSMEEKNLSGIADIEIILGEDFAKRF